MTSLAPQIHFTVSACTNFLLAFKSRIIYIYALRKLPYDGNTQPYGGFLELVTSIICPDRVLTVSMDTSCQRYAVAALLHGSIGIVHDLDLVNHPVPWTDTKASDTRARMYEGKQGSGNIPSLSRKFSQESLPYKHASFGTVYRSPKHQAFPRDTAEAPFIGDCHESHRSRTWALGDRFYPPRPIDTAYRAYPPVIMQTNRGSFSVYRDLCSVNDPPRSVVICPRSRCVAFGCRRGIELHWTDALNGQDLKRWFPLSAPADHLFLHAC